MSDPRSHIVHVPPVTSAHWCGAPHFSCWCVQVVATPDVIRAASRPQGARQAGSLERALQGAAMGAAAGFAGASGALAEYVDPDDVSDC